MANGEKGKGRSQNQRLKLLYLLDTTAATTSTSLDEIAAVLDRCTAQEAKVIADVVKAAKTSMDKHF